MSIVDIIEAYTDYTDVLRIRRYSASLHSIEPFVFTAFLCPKVKVKKKEGRKKIHQTSEQEGGINF